MTCKLGVSSVVFMTHYNSLLVWPQGSEAFGGVVVLPVWMWFCFSDIWCYHNKKNNPPQHSSDLDSPHLCLWRGRHGDLCGLHPASAWDQLGHIVTPEVAIIKNCRLKSKRVQDLFQLSIYKVTMGDFSLDYYIKSVLLYSSIYVFLVRSRVHWQEGIKVLFVFFCRFEENWAQTFVREVASHGCRQSCSSLVLMLFLKKRKGQSCLIWV